MSGSAVGISHADASGLVTVNMTVHDGRTILDRLNEDCWRLVLDYVLVEDIIRSERVSRRWQGMVHCYLEEVGICVAYEFFSSFAHRDVKRHPKNRILQNYRKTEKILRAFREKWGAYMVYTFCSSRFELNHISLCCPKLKGLAIQMLRFGTGRLSQSQLIFCEKLEQLMLIHLTRYSDLEHDDRYNQTADEDKRTDSYKNVNNARAFISNIKPTKLESLTVCGIFDFCHFLAYIPCFPELTKLTVQGNSSNIPVLLAKTQKLERLVLMELHNDVESCKPMLSHLKHLTVYEYSGITLVESLANCDMHTLSLVIVHKELVQAAIKLMRTRTDWRSLSEIKMLACEVTDDDVAAMIAACPILKTLEVTGCDEFSSQLVPRAARAARGRKVPLLLKIGGTKAAVPSLDQAQYPELILDMEPPGSWVPWEMVTYYEY